MLDRRLRWPWCLHQHPWASSEVDWSEAPPQWVKVTNRCAWWGVTSIQRRWMEASPNAWLSVCEVLIHLEPWESWSCRWWSQCQMIDVSPPTWSEAWTLQSTPEGTWVREEDAWCWISDCVEEMTMSHSSTDSDWAHLTMSWTTWGCDTAADLVVPDHCWLWDCEWTAASWARRTLIRWELSTIDAWCLTWTLKLTLSLNGSSWRWQFWVLELLRGLREVLADLIKLVDGLLNNRLRDVELADDCNIWWCVSWELKGTCPKGTLEFYKNFTKIFRSSLEFTRISLEFY